MCEIEALKTDFLAVAKEGSSSSEFLECERLWPKVSVVMPSFNQAAYIERSLLSVINQGYPNLELILIDGGSTDGTVNLIRKYEKYITYWISEPDRGQSEALNKGFSRATGEIFGWLNSDDIYLPDAIMSGVSALQACPEKLVVFGDWATIDERDALIEREFAFDMNINQTKYEGVSVNAQAMFWRKEVHQRFGGFDLSLYNTMDYQMILAFAVREGASAFLRIPLVLGCFRRYLGQKTGPANFQRQIEEHRLLAERYEYLDKYTWVGRLKRYIYRARRGYWYFKRGGLSYFLEKGIGSHELKTMFRKKT